MRLVSSRRSHAAPSSTQLRDAGSTHPGTLPSPSYVASFACLQVNNCLMDADAESVDAGLLGILDIYGFENFERNSLEQVGSK